MVRSVNGAAVTMIDGQDAVRCVALTNGAALSGFTLTRGHAVSGCIGNLCTSLTGGGVWCQSGGAVVSNCVLTGNSAGEGGGANGVTLYNCTLSGNSAYEGGGAIVCTLYNCTLSGNSASSIGGGANVSALFNCTLTGNSATDSGGGAVYSTLNNCTLSGNSAGNTGGGAYGSTLNNCIVYYNSAPDGNNYSGYASLLSYSCTAPLPATGIGNLTNAPLFVNQAGGNLRLQASSPCINSGSNVSAPAGPDLDGNPRIAGGTVDIGAYEFQSPTSLISYAWLQQYALPTDGSADSADPDADGLNNWQEWRTGTNPTNALSVLRLLSPASSAAGVIVRWQSVVGRNYFLERSAQLGARLSFLPLATNISGQPGTTTFTDTNAIGVGPFFYRVGVQD
jgi:predicted outer membrane repeat protein